MERGAKFARHQDKNEISIINKPDREEGLARPLMAETGRAGEGEGKKQKQEGGRGERMRGWQVQARQTDEGRETWYKAG